jgi:hypothetical protein
MFLWDYFWGMAEAKEEGIAETEAKWQAKEMKWQTEEMKWQAEEMKRQADRIAKARELKRRGVDYETIMIATDILIDEIKRLE